MKYYKSDDGLVYVYESDGSQDDWIKPDLIPITKSEALAMMNPPLTPEQLQQGAEREKQYRQLLASNAIAPLQYAVDLEMATNGEQATLTAWKKYCVLLNRVDCSAAPDIQWPEQLK
ncbi:tail fiber assembly protein [Xenorhabdus szentirmaii]|uniref:tail fiber assembly protein n=1 Tax=Xenorhabdus szentirmaii TaxID=290112 RepID=UPI0019A32C67|nr:tail fiber assembly protein [Xenorhabdus sp. 38]MBD2779790.1 tail fiber assembly protein [Xenorhabdus sp. 38]